MNRKYYSALAVSAVALGTVVLTATEASATREDPQPRPTSQPAPWPDEGSGFPGSANTTPEYNYPKYDPKYEVTAPTKATPAKVTAQSSSDGNGVELLQSGASALGGAAVALSGVWLYRRRQLPTA
jgi:hypothetical protein